MASQYAVLPPKSDVSCYEFQGSHYCDVDVRPSKLKLLGPRSDEDLPDFGDDGASESSKRGL